MKHFTRCALAVIASCISFCTQAQTELWSVAPAGGTDGIGTLFKINPDGTQFKTAYNFPFSTLNASFPIQSTPCQANNGLLYSMTSDGGVYNNGCIFSYDTTSNVFTLLYSFTGGTDGSTPNNSMIKANNGLLYGMTSAGGNSLMESFSVSTLPPIHTLSFLILVVQQQVQLR